MSCNPDTRSITLKLDEMSYLLLRDFARQLQRTPEDLAATLLTGDIESLHAPGELDAFASALPEVLS